MEGAAATGQELRRQSAIWAAEAERLHSATRRVVEHSEQLAAQQQQQQHAQQQQQQQQPPPPTPRAPAGVLGSATVGSAAVGSTGSGGSRASVAELSQTAAGLGESDVRTLLQLARRLSAR